MKQDELTKTFMMILNRQPEHPGFMAACWDDDRMLDQRHKCYEITFPITSQPYDIPKTGFVRIICKCLLIMRF